MREVLPGTGGMLATSSDFTPSAIAEAATVGLELVGRRDLLRRLQEGGAVHLLAAVRDVERSHRCPNCAEPMVLGRSPHGWWLHCPRYTTGCQGKRDLGTAGRKALELLITSAWRGQPKTIRPTGVRRRRKRPRRLLLSQHEHGAQCLARRGGR